MSVLKIDVDRIDAEIAAEDELRVPHSYSIRKSVANRFHKVCPKLKMSRILEKLMLAYIEAKTNDTNKK